MTAGSRGRRELGSEEADGLEARIAALEVHVAHIRDDVTDIKLDVRSLRDDARTDFHLLFGALIVTTLGTAGLMARGFGWL